MERHSASLQEPGSADAFEEVMRSAMSPQPSRVLRMDLSAFLSRDFCDPELQPNISSTSAQEQMQQCRPTGNVNDSLIVQAILAGQHKNQALPTSSLLGLQLICLAACSGRSMLQAGRGFAIIYICFCLGIAFASMLLATPPCLVPNLGRAPRSYRF